MHRTFDQKVSLAAQVHFRLENSTHMEAARTNGRWKETGQSREEARDHECVLLCAGSTFNLTIKYGNRVVFLHSV